MLNPKESLPARRFTFSLLALAVLALVAGVPASASTLAWTAPASGITINYSVTPMNLGDVFVSNNDETVTALGIYAAIPYTTWEVVALYDATGNLLTEANINPSIDPIVDGYYWSPALAYLYAGETYTVVDFSNESNPGWSYSNTNPTDGWATFLYDDYSSNPTVSFPTLTSGTLGTAFYGADIMANEAGPEPQSLLLLGSGLIGLAGLLKFRRRRN
jgi:hypothetical protein